ncbi:MAG TPA: cell division FtsA domain-containing protein [Thermotogota bacterium]|nr:cell division FtsA domain-containing protein [Thermotogota bacterium]
MIYALDIGTRTVIGVLAEKYESNIVVYDSQTREHEERAMLDGAIHDVNKVSKIVQNITKDLKEKNEIEITSVSVALAGRFLKTSIGESRMDVSSEHSISKDTVRMLEMEAINRSIEALETDGREMYCVGYSVLYYNLDDEWIKNLEGQRGKEISVKVIAAFLPAYVVNAMMNVLEKSGLTPEHITLEPIAAMNLVVPPDLRRLNIVLVDVGAGTSDIAVSRDGTVIAYGMVPMAGDEITERLCEEYLIDFNSAERVKRTLSDPDQEKTDVKDILDTPLEITKEDFIRVAEPVIDEITTKVSDEILNLNGKPPAAVMVVGGGARVPLFTEYLAKKLDLPANRVSLKSIENIQNVEDKTNDMIGSQYVTPVSIANSVNTNTGSVFVRVMVNDKAVDLMGMDNKNNVMQALLQLGYRVEEIVGKPGPAITFDLNNEMKIIKGLPGKSAQILINGEKGGIHTKLQHGDIIDFMPGKEGKATEIFLSEILTPISITLNGEGIDLLPQARINGEMFDGDIQIKDGDAVFSENYCNINYLLEKLSRNREEFINIVLNSKNKAVKVKEIEIHRGDRKLSSEDRIFTGDVLTMRDREMTPNIKKLTGDFAEKQCKVLVNSREMFIPATSFTVNVDGVKAEMESVLYEGAIVDLKLVEEAPKIVDLLALMDIDSSSLKSFNIKINDRKAAFMDMIKEGDKIEIVLEK